VQFHHGERLRIVLRNDTMMAHPIHLHGMFGELEAPNGEVLVRKHTFVVQPGKQLSYLSQPTTRAMGLPLPSALSHGGRDVPRGSGGMKRALTQGARMAGAAALLTTLCVHARMTAGMDMDDAAKQHSVFVENLEGVMAIARAVRGMFKHGMAATSISCG